MHAAADRPEFEPPPQPGFVRALTLALFAHALLMMALTWGVRWNRESQDLAAEAELWSSLPQQAAPKEVVTAPPPPPPPAPVVKEEPKPEPKPKEADIALEREKEKRREAEEDERKERARKKAAAEKEKREEQEKLAAEKKRKEKLDEQRVAKLRQENLERMRGMAGSSDSPKGTAAQTSGPSGNWAGRVRARVKPNIVFTDDIAGNPKAEVEVRLAPDGTIVGKKLVRSSGHTGWDNAVLRALDKTEVLPRDTDGRVPSSVILEFRPKD
jgi:colicin import membrane protein